MYDRVAQKFVLTQRAEKRAEERGQPAKFPPLFRARPARLRALFVRSALGKGADAACAAVKITYIDISALGKIAERVFHARGVRFQCRRGSFDQHLCFQYLVSPARLGVYRAEDGGGQFVKHSTSPPEKAHALPLLWQLLYHYLTEFANIHTILQRISEIYFIPRKICAIISNKNLFRRALHETEQRKNDGSFEPLYERDKISRLRRLLQQFQADRAERFQFRL